MKYRASKHYAHLSIDEPIPEIELRYNEPMRAGYESFARHAWWAITAIFVSQLFLAIFLKKTITGTLLSLGFGFGILFFMVGVVFKAQMKEGKNDPDDPWGVPIRDQIRYWFFYAIVMWSVMAGFRMFSDGIIEGVFTLAWYTLMFGVGLAVCGRFARQPGQISCMKCDYPLVGLQLPCPCPECGTTISALSDATDRPRARDTRLVLIGIAIVVLSLATIVLRFYRPQALYTAMPRAALIQLAPNDRSAFESLMGTAITPAEEDRLEDALIDAIASGNTVGFWTHQQGSWLAQRAFNNGLTQAQLDRMLDPFTRAGIDAPERVRIGTPITLRVGAPDEYNPDYRLDPDVYFGGFVIADDPTAHARQSTRQSRDRLVEGSGPSMVWIPDAPGVVTVHARLVWVIDPNIPKLDQLGLTWNPDGTHSFENPPVWSRVIELEHTITIEE